LVRVSTGQVGGFPRETQAFIFRKVKPLSRFKKKHKKLDRNAEPRAESQRARELAKLKKAENGKQANRPAASEAIGEKLAGLPVPSAQRV
jgi:hypothetical protein